MLWCCFADLFQRVYSCFSLLVTEFVDAWDVLFLYVVQKVHAFFISRKYSIIIQQIKKSNIQIFYFCFYYSFKIICVRYLFMSLCLLRGEIYLKILKNLLKIIIKIESHTFLTDFWIIYFKLFDSKCVDVFFLNGETLLFSDCKKFELEDLAENTLFCLVLSFLNLSVVVWLLSIGFFKFFCNFPSLDFKVSNCDSTLFIDRHPK